MERRCLHSKNPCGTDTWMVGHSCPCDHCQAYLSEKDVTADTSMYSCVEHGHSKFLSSPCPRCSSIPLSIKPVRCTACYECLDDPSLGMANPVNTRMILCPICGNKRCPQGDLARA